MSPLTAHTALAQHRITRLVSQLSTHRAFHWLHLHQPQMLSWQMEFLAIPAPPFGEDARAEWFLQAFRTLGLTNVHRDGAGNALAELPGENAGPYLLVSAHLDTVFPPETVSTPTLDGTRILCPGACDNGAGLAALLGLVAALRSAGIVPRSPVLFAANTGEEGEGDLRGMRELFTRGAYAGRIGAALALEGSGTATTVTRALGSRRFRVTVSGPGGHSWTDAGAPNPITLMARAIAALAELPSLRPDAEEAVRTTLSAGQISGGTSVNSIPSAATATFDLRSTEPEPLQHLTLELHRTFERIVGQSNRDNPGLRPAALLVEPIGERPAAALADDAPLLHTLRAVDRHLGLRTELRLGSTDANLPLSLGISAAALAAGGTGGGIHTLAEWYDPTGRETALRRLLLTILDAAQQMAP